MNPSLYLKEMLINMFQEVHMLYFFIFKQKAFKLSIIRPRSSFFT